LEKRIGTLISTTINVLVTDGYLLRRIKENYRIKINGARINGARPHLENGAWHHLLSLDIPSSFFFLRLESS
jgi:hypothetical protein